jgi:undecaprenyl-phosphate galactose phosphotransferase
MPEEKEKMGDYYDRIASHKPGMTGVFQISAKERVTFEERLDMDIKYHYRRTVKTDLKIVIITLLVTFVRKETYNLGEITADTAGYISRLCTLFVKRIIDIIGAIVGIIILIPLTVIIKLVNVLNKDYGPIFYSHERIGKNGKHFKMYKFRSMCMNSQEILEKLLAEDEEARKEWNDTMKLRNDPRITKIGKFLRKTSLDEFPQFINVLKGEMSLVGPRAIIDDEVAKFGVHMDTVFSVKPGITGNWAVNGRSDTSYEERVELERYYAENISLWFDIEILIKTVISVLKKEGAV